MNNKERWETELANLLLLDRTGELDEAEVLYPFALEELLCRHVGEGGAPLVHLWRHPRAFVMGLRDSRLPGAGAASQWLEAQGYSVAVRNSGGAAVPLDLGVVNVSLILPKHKQGDIDFRHDFERMYRLIQQALHETGAGVDKGQIQGAYCPGDYDLSIGGRKFCGIAQRRQAHAYVVQAFVVVAGSGEARSALAAEFYDRAAPSADGVGPAAADHPRVQPGSMGSLEELAGLSSERGAEDFAEAVKRVIRQRQSPDGMISAAGSLWLPDRGHVMDMVQTLRSRYGLKD